MVIGLQEGTMRKRVVEALSGPWSTRPVLRRG